MHSDEILTLGELVALAVRGDKPKNRYVQIEGRIYDAAKQYDQSVISKRLKRELKKVLAIDPMVQLQLRRLAKARGKKI